MTHHDHDASTDVSMDEPADLEEAAELTEPAGRVASAASDALASGTLPLLGGGLLLAAAVRALARNRPRALPLGIAGSGLIGFGLHNRRSSGESPTDDGVPDIESGTEGKETSDGAAAAATRVDSGRESEIEPDGEISADPGVDDAAESGSRVEFTDDPDADESRSRPDLGEEETEPRRETETDDIAVDVSDTAMADETSEATGPDPTQAQPTQTADTEPEASPAEDASEKQVEPPDESEAETDEEDATGDDDSDESDR
ncbi:prolipoprotein diacylglyceryl transferase [Natrinema ejinorense]|uniref:Uncharacterized protein n=1 Tax=Natrinema ejinorense TaxID=373386 RepID=A0A2A5QQX1_9EURY|nr:hypothetical protein [Natrinema ejinorense]PCR89199.1 hypothetical protein CP557_00785 [Natrinema ejinorense]